MIPVLPTKTLKGFPKHAEGGRVWYMSLGVALLRRFDSDAHFAVYSVPTLERRLTQDAIREIPDGIPLVAAVFDVDCETSHKASGATTPAPASDDWWLAEQPKIEALRRAHPSGFIYRTLGGYRIVYRLEGLVLREPEDAASWTARYAAWVAYLHLTFGIHADVACADWTRLYRLPFVLRDGRRQARETIGDANAIGVWTCEPSAEAFELARTLKPPKRPRTIKAPEERSGYASAGDGVLFHAFRARNMLGSIVEPGTWAIACPWETSHTKGSTYDSSTVLFAPGPGEDLGWPHCSHSHCTGRRLGDWLKLFAEEELVTARVAAGVPPRKDDGAGAEPSSVGPEAAHDDELPTIILGVDEHRVADEAIAALTKLPGLYQRGGALVDVVTVDDRIVIRTLPQPRVRELLALSARWVTQKTDPATGEITDMPAHPPEWCVRAVMSRGEWPTIPRLFGVLQAPALRKDGSVIQDAGLDATGFLYLPTVAFPRVPDLPTHADAVRARDELLEVVADFPFATEGHRAAWLGFALTAFARPAFEGCSPLVAIDAPTRGTGKGRMVDATSVLVTGRDASKAPQPKDDEEMRKRITSVLREGECIQVIDNVSRRVEDASLDACVTATVWKDRALGKNETIALPNLTMWVVTGNNLEFGADTARRTLHIRLESTLENPEDRDDFAHPDLLAWTRTERPRLVCAALTLLRAYVVAGRPASPTCKPWGSFEGWSRLIAHAVVWVGMADPQATRVELESSSDTRKAALVALLLGWERLAPHGLSARSAVEALYPAERLKGQMPPDGYEDLREAIEGLVPTQPGRQPSPTKLAYVLRQSKRRPIGGRMFDSIDDRRGIAQWRVISARASKSASSRPESAGDAGDAGHVPNPSRERLEEEVNTRAHARMRMSTEHPRHRMHDRQEEEQPSGVHPQQPGTEPEAPFASWLAEKGVA